MSLSRSGSFSDTCSSIGNASPSRNIEDQRLEDWLLPMKTTGQVVASTPRLTRAKHTPRTQRSWTLQVLTDIDRPISAALQYCTVLALGTGKTGINCELPYALTATLSCRVIYGAGCNMRENARAGLLLLLNLFCGSEFYARQVNQKGSASRKQQE